MKIQLEQAGGQNNIRAYARGRVTVNQDVYTESLVVMPDRLLVDWRPRTFGDLAPADIEVITGLDPEVVLLGTGNRLMFPSPALTRSLVAAQIGFEAMDTGAACRTYNVLMAEGRRVAAALLIEEE